LLSYWVASFTIDFIISDIAVIIVWAVLLICQIQSFLDDSFNIGLSFILSIDRLSFCFSDASAASRQAFLAMPIVGLIQMIIDIVLSNETSAAFDRVYVLFPLYHVQQILTYGSINLSACAHGLRYSRKYNMTQPTLIMHYVDILICGGILWLIEFVRVSLQASDRTKRDFFKQAKAKRPVTPEAHAMEEKVANTHTGYVVRISNCSRVLFHTSGQPIPAANCVFDWSDRGIAIRFLRCKRCCQNDSH
jgi:hypothetical protein